MATMTTAIVTPLMAACQYHKDKAVRIASEKSKGEVLINLYRFTIVGIIS